MNSRQDPSAQVDKSFSWKSQTINAGLMHLRTVRPVLLLHLKGLLDSYHHESREAAYYDFVAGSWLDGYCHSLYTAWIMAKRSSNGGGKPKPIPKIQDAMEALLTNIQTGQHDALVDIVRAQLDRSLRPSWDASAPTRPAAVWARPWAQLERWSTQVGVSRQPRLLMVEPALNCATSEKLRVLIRWRKWAKLERLRYPIDPAQELDTKWRVENHRAHGETENFVDLATALMPLYLPIIYLEGFVRFRAALLASAPPCPSAVFSAEALHTNCAYQILVAEWRQLGTRVLYQQHGGGYGLHPNLAIEERELAVSDRYYSWGWRRAGFHISTLGPAIVSPQKGRARQPFLLVCNDSPRALFRLIHSPMGAAIDDMHRQTFEFLKEIAPDTPLAIRPFQQDYSGYVHASLRRLATQARFETGGSSMRCYENYRMIIHSYLGTSWLETIGMNMPTMCFFDPEAYAFRSEVNPHIEQLRQVGVLHDSGRTAAKFLHTVARDIKGWWNSSDVQAAREEFAANYAAFSPDWSRQWESALLSEVE
jgi:putative transferase (TIGR04331 family)